MTFDDWYEQYEYDGEELVLFNTIDLANAFEAGKAEGIKFVKQFVDTRLLYLMEEEIKKQETNI
jgi:hypothetical protein